MKVNSKIYTGIINTPKKYKISHLFEDLTHSEATPEKRTPQEKGNALLFFEKSFPFLGRLNGFDLSKKSRGRFPPHPSTLPKGRGEE